MPGLHDVSTTSSGTHEPPAQLFCRAFRAPPPVQWPACPELAVLGNTTVAPWHAVVAGLASGPNDLREELGRGGGGIGQPHHHRAPEGMPVPSDDLCPGLVYRCTAAMIPSNPRGAESLRLLTRYCDDGPVAPGCVFAELPLPCTRWGTGMDRGRAAGGLRAAIGWMAPRGDSVGAREMPRCLS